MFTKEFKTLEAEGIVVRTEGMSAIVRIRRTGACGDSCAHCSGCDAAMMEIVAKCKFPVSSGDLVRVTSDRRYVFLGLVVLFLVPIILPMLAYFLSVGTGKEAYFVIAAIVFAFVLILILNKNQKYKKACQPQVCEVIDKVRKCDE